MKRGGAVSTTILIVFLLVTLAGTVTPAFPQDEEFDVTCYKGNLDEGNEVGNLTVTVPANAGQLCNTTYYDCGGKCLGCLLAPDLGEEVCYDNAGKKFLK